jgi:hypothetical protein
MGVAKRKNARAVSSSAHRPDTTAKGSTATKFDLDFRPETYWDERRFLANITGTVRRQLLEEALKDPNAPAAVFEVFSDSERTKEIMPLLGIDYGRSVSGEYLRPCRANETEIARLWTPKTTFAEVISIRARRTKTGIIYSIIDDFCDGTSYQFSPKSSQMLLTFGELIRLLESAKRSDNATDHIGFVTGWWENELQCIRSCTEHAMAEELRDHIVAQSYFYPQLAEWYRDQFEKWVVTKRPS